MARVLPTSPRASRFTRYFFPAGRTVGKSSVSSSFHRGWAAFTPRTRPAAAAAGVAGFLPFGCSREALSAAVVELKYEGYLKKQEQAVKEQRRLEEKLLPPDIDYFSISALRLEARQKLDRIRPLNLGQASRISGVSPADIAVLIVLLSRGAERGE